MKKIATVIITMIICISAYGQGHNLRMHEDSGLSIGIDLTSIMKNESIDLTIGHRISRRWTANVTSRIGFSHFRKRKEAEEYTAHRNEFEMEKATAEHCLHQAAVSMEYLPAGTFLGPFIGMGGEAVLNGHDMRCICSIGYRIGIHAGLHLQLSLEEVINIQDVEYDSNTCNIRLRLCYRF